MKILALDTSSRAVSCALICDGTLTGELFANTGLTHSQTAMPLVKQLLDQTGIDVSDIDLFAVSAGPGSFTGLRIGIAAVKGMAMAAGKSCAAVSTLLGLAFNAQFFSGYIAPVMDARRSQVYTALFRSGGSGITRQTPDEAIPLTNLREQLQALAPSPVILTGDGALMAAAELSGLPHVSTAPERFLHQRAGSVAAAAAEMAAHGELISPDELAPVYLRLPQAERELLEKLTVDN